MWSNVHQLINYKGMEIQLAGTYFAWKRAAKCSDDLRWFRSHWKKCISRVWICLNQIESICFEKHRSGFLARIPCHPLDTIKARPKSWVQRVEGMSYATSSHPQSPSMTIDGWWVPPASPDCKVRLAAATKVYCIVRGQDSPVAWLPQIWLYMTTRLPYSIMVFNQWLMEFPCITGSIVSLSSQRHELWNVSCTDMCARFFCLRFVCRV